MIHITKKLTLYTILLFSCLSIAGCDKSGNQAAEDSVLENTGTEPAVTWEPSIAAVPETTENDSNMDDNTDKNTAGKDDSSDKNNADDNNLDKNDPAIDGTEGNDPENNSSTDDTYNDPSSANKATPVPTPSSKILFDKVKDTVYATAAVNIRSMYSLNESNIIATLPKGASVMRTGMNEEWSEVSYQGKTCYIKTRYLSKEKPVSTPAPTKAPAASDHTDSSESDFISDLKIASEADKIICVIGNGGADCTVTFHSKDEDGKWVQEFTTDGDLGSKGITYNKKEGDGKTPAGLYYFTLAFGIKADPGSILPYRRITEYDYWIDDSKSPYYNTWVNSKETPGKYKSEHLIDHSPQYNYALNINYNADRIPGLGSAIFLHGYNGTGKTTGCIAIPEKYMKTLVRRVDASTPIIIVPDMDALSDY